MKIKVCGMKIPDNIAAIEKLKPDFMGFIFYNKSPRFVDEEKEMNISAATNQIAKVGVFVNASIDYITRKAKSFPLDYVQLHGDESPEYAKELHSKGVKIIKAFQIKSDFDWSSLKAYQKSVDYFLFDTPTANYGGSGKQFDWSKLSKYEGSTPFFLSGGIGLEDIQEIKKLKLSLLFGIDVNSKFESAPGEKDEELVKTMINQVRNGSKI